MRSPFPGVLTLLFMVAGPLSPGGHAAPREIPPWLHVEPRPPSASSVPSSLLFLGAERQPHYVEEGFHTADLLQRFELIWENDTTLTRRETRVRQYLTDEGVRQGGNLGVNVRTDVEELWIDEAWIALPGAPRRPADLDAIQVVSMSDFDIFSDTVRVVVPFDGLTAGATAVLVMRVVERPREWPLPWSDLFFPQGFSPVERFDLEMTWEPSLSRPILLTDASFLDCAGTAGHVRCSAEAIPAMRNDDDSTIWSDVMPQVVVGEDRSWADLAEAERVLFEESMSRDAGLDRTLRSLLRGIDGPLERLERLHRFVADEIRYLGLEHGQAAVAPATVERTLRARYGDCKGKVALFVAMARRAGLRAYPVVVSTLRNDLDKLLLPSWQYFDHMIACVEVGLDPEPLCMDLTTPNAATGSLPPGLYGSVALDLKEGVTAPRTLRSSRPVWDIDVGARNEFDCQGNVVETTRRVFKGPAAVWERGLLRGLTVEQRTERERDLFSDEVEPEVSFSGLEDPSSPLEVATTVPYTEVISEDQKEYVERDRWLRFYAQYFATENERHPAWIAGGRVRSEMTFRPCAVDEIELVGAQLDMRSEFGVLTRRYQRKGREVTVQTELEVPTQTLTGEDLARYQRFFEHALEQTLVWFRLRRGGSQGGPQ